MLSIKRVTNEDSDFNKLVDLLDQDLNNRNYEDQAVYDPYNKIVSLNTVVVAYLKDEAVGCGCFKKYNPSTVEMKRVYVKPSVRGKGIAKQIMADLELWAMQLGYKKAILETGINQPEAIGLYERLGYKRIPNFDQYANMPSSVCMEKLLSISNFSAGE
jgi:putative acetyltransferase